MKTRLVHSLVLIAACGWPASAYCEPFIAFGFYTLRADVSGSAIVGGQHVFDSPPAASHPTNLSISRMLSASVEEAGGSGHASGDLTFSAQPGRLAIFADALADARINPGHGLGVAAGADNNVTVQIDDEWDFHTERTRRTHINAFFRLSSNLATSVHGVNATLANGRRDEVDALAGVELRVFGTGVPPAPYTSHGPQDFGFVEEGILSATINPHTRGNPPTIIPLSFDFEGDSGGVFWGLQVIARATVGNTDIINNEIGIAIALGEVSHSLTWGGITSVTDADTGEPISDFRLTSASGFDYTHAFVPEGPGSLPVPEPSTLLLLAPVLGTWMGMTLLRRSCARAPSSSDDPAQLCRQSIFSYSNRGSRRSFTRDTDAA